MWTSPASEGARHTSMIPSTTRLTTVFSSAEALTASMHKGELHIASELRFEGGGGRRDHVLSCLAGPDGNTRMERPDFPGAGRLTLLSMEAKTGPRPTGMGASFGPNRRSSEAEDDVNILRLLCSVALKSLPLIDPPYPYDHAHSNIVMISPRLPSLNEKDIQDGENSRSQHCSLICSSWPCPNGNRGGGTSCCQRLTSPAAPFAQASPSLRRHPVRQRHYMPRYSSFGLSTLPALTPH